MNAERLLRAADVIEGIPDDISLFNMEEWACGTARCAIGWCCSDKSFIKEGLRLFISQDHAYPAYKNTDGTEAVELFFDINETTFEQLFGSSLNYTPVVIASRIRNFVKENREINLS